MAASATAEAYNPSPVSHGKDWQHAGRTHLCKTVGITEYRPQRWHYHFQRDRRCHYKLVAARMDVL